MSELVIRDLHAAVGDFEILHGVSLTVRSGEVHALMGPNGSGKSTLAHVLAGRPDYTVAGSVTLDSRELLGLPTWERAAEGLFWAFQYPVEVPGVKVGDLLTAAARQRGMPPDEVDGLGARVHEEATRLSVAPELLDRGVNDQLSGGEAKRMETLQLAVLAPTFAVIDEIDSGLDVDALRAVARRIEAMTTDGLGVLSITHYTRLLAELRADAVHVLMAGKIVASGGPELAAHLEEVGYEGLASELGVQKLALERPGAKNPFAEPGF